MKKRVIRKIPVVIVVATLGILAFSGLVMLLWNSTLPAVLHVGTITLWQAAGILLLSKILLGGRRGSRAMWDRRHGKRMFMSGHCTTEAEEEQINSHGCYYNRYGKRDAESAGQPIA